MLSFFSVNNIITGLSSVIKRFPFAALFCLIWTISCIAFIEDSFEFRSKERIELVHIIMSSFIGILSFVIVSVFLESNSNYEKYTWPLRILALVCVLGYFFSLADNLQDYPYKPAFVFISWVILLLLGISFIPFLQERSNIKYWNYYKTLFFNFVESAFYSLVLIAGICLALLALHFLFSLDIKSSLYGDVCCGIIGLFFSFHYLYQFPKQPFPEEVDSKTRVYTVFSSYILIPLVLIYFIILYAFGIKLLFTEWPDGWVASLILWFSILGIITYLFNHPFSENESKISYYYKLGFFYSLIPLSFLLFFAIKKRISEFHLTELRIWVLLMALWIFGISVYFIFSKSKQVKWIPISLFLIGILSLYGPWSVFNIASNSQFNRFNEIAVKNDLIQQEQLLPFQASVSARDKQELGKTIDYLDSRKSLDKILIYLPEELIKKDSDLVDRAELLNYLGYSDQEIGSFTNDREIHTFQSTLPEYIPLEDFDFLLPVYHYPIESKGDSIYVNLDIKNSKINILYKHNILDKFDMSLIINDLYINNITNYSSFDYEYFRLNSDLYVGRLYVTNLNYFPEKEFDKILSMEGFLLLKSKL